MRFWHGSAMGCGKVATLGSSRYFRIMSHALRHALVLFSGGQDSTTCLAWALDRYAHVETVAFDYGQRHHVELEARQNVLHAMRSTFPDWAARLGEDHVLDLGVIGQVGGTAMTQAREIVTQANGLPNTFVPGRNLMFLTVSAALGYRRGIDILVTGVCETDYSGYPDCRDDTMKSQQVTLGLGLDARITIDTPLMWIDKAATWQLAHDLGGDALVDVVIEHSHTCYLGDRTQRHDWGYGCGTCPACELRSSGWLQWTAERRLP